MPIRSLADRHRPRILAHLLSFGEQDRYLRFGYVASDDQIAQYVASIDFDRDEVYGIFNRRLRLLAMAHLAAQGRPPGGDEAPHGASRTVEFGVSVLPRARGRGFGQRLFDRAVLHARNHGADTMVIHALSDNAAMLRIARKSGASVVRAGGEVEARLQLPPDDFVSHWGEMVAEGSGQFDYRLKLSARQLDALLGNLGARSDEEAQTSPVEE